ncbi:MAG: hypothetical protein FWC77_08435 [Defluviitaleaceae bacterium]|nr:hypothetical protein [Defluviitaleaceae bacterium]
MGLVTFSTGFFGKPLNDRLIGYTIVTNNIKDFENIDGLMIADWTQPQA